MAENTSTALVIRHDLVWGYCANTTPKQTAVILDLFEVEGEDFFLNHPDAARLHVEGLDFIAFQSRKLPEIKKILGRSKGRILLCPTVEEVPETVWPPAALALLKLEIHPGMRVKMPPDYYKERGFTAADIPDIERLFRTEELRLNEDNTTSCALAARRGALRALFELRAPGLARMCLEEYHAAGVDAFTLMVPEEAMQVFELLGANAYHVGVAMLEEHRDEAGFCDDIRNWLFEIVKNSAPELREHYIGVLTRHLQNYPFNARDHNGFSVGNLCELKAVEAAPLIAQAYAADCVDVSVCGDWESAQIDLGLKTQRDTPQSEEDAAIRRERMSYLGGERARKSPYVRSAPKTGRNDPCPCGSGKKYKKCCLGNAN